MISIKWCDHISSFKVWTAWPAVCGVGGGPARHRCERMIQNEMVAVEIKVEIPEKGMGFHQ